MYNVIGGGNVDFTLDKSYLLVPFVDEMGAQSSRISVGRPHEQTQMSSGALFQQTSSAKQVGTIFRQQKRLEGLITL